MEENENVVGLLSDIKGLLSHTKKVMNVEDLAAYTGLSKSKIYKHTIDAWLLGEPDLSDETLERRFNESLLKNRK